jgi:hypothetical protein
MEEQLATVYVYTPGQDVLLEVTDGKKVVMQLRADGTLLFVGRVKVVNEIQKHQSKDTEIDVYDTMNEIIANQTESGFSSREE